MKKTILFISTLLFSLSLSAAYPQAEQRQAKEKACMENVAQKFFGYMQSNPYASRKEFCDAVGGREMTDEECATMVQIMYMSGDLSNQINAYIFAKAELHCKK